MHAVFFLPRGRKLCPFFSVFPWLRIFRGNYREQGQGGLERPTQPCLSDPELNTNFLSQQRRCLKLLIASLNLFSQIAKRPSPRASGGSRAKGSPRESGHRPPQPAGWRPAPPALASAGTQAVRSREVASSAPRPQRESRHDPAAVCWDLPPDLLHIQIQHGGVPRCFQLSPHRPAFTLFPDTSFFHRNDDAIAFLHTKSCVLVLLFLWASFPEAESCNIYTCVCVLIVRFSKPHKSRVGRYARTPPANLSILQRTNLMGGITSHCRAQWQRPQRCDHNLITGLCKYGLILKKDLCTRGCQREGGWERGGLGAWGQQMQTIIDRTGKQQSPMA